MINKTLLDMIKRHEGYRQFPYRCSAGAWTVGWGRNLDANGISESEAHLMLLNDCYHAIQNLDHYPWFAQLDDVRQDALVDMMFNLGAARFAKFKKMLAALDAGDYQEAAAQALDSKWATQVGQRAKTIAGMLRTGEYPTTL